jgi:anaerobic ribonucleoside-triphosphate reductase activating protein
MADRLRLHHFLPASRANGPGNRAVIWVQGCSLGCPGCFNPATHPPRGGQVVAVDDLFQRLLALEQTIEGLTISGGEPLQQPAPLLALLQRVRQESRLSVLLFTGFTWPEVQRRPAAMALLAGVDVLLAGRYEAARRLARNLRGSANKTVHFLTGRYSPEDLQAVPPAEVIIAPDGQVVITGIDPLK